MPAPRVGWFGTDLFRSRGPTVVNAVRARTSSPALVRASARARPARRAYGDRTSAHSSRTIAMGIPAVTEPHHAGQGFDDVAELVSGVLH